MKIMFEYKSAMETHVETEHWSLFIQSKDVSTVGEFLFEKCKQ